MTRGTNVFIRLKNIGANIFNMMLMNEISSLQARGIIEILGLDTKRGTTASNFRNLVNLARAEIEDNDDLTQYPFMAPYGFKSSQEYVLAVLGEKDKAKQLQSQFDKVNKQLTRTQDHLKDNPTDNGASKKKKIQPIEELHFLAIQTKPYAINGFFVDDDGNELVGLKGQMIRLYHEILVSVLKHDVDLEEIDINEIMKQADLTSGFIMEIADMYPDIPINEMYLEFLRKLKPPEEPPEQHEPVTEEIEEEKNV